MLILLLEDNDDDARLLRLALTEAAGKAVEICHVRRVSEALEQLTSHSFDVVLMDLGLPDCQGLETYRAIARRAPEMAVVVMSGLLDEELATRAVQLGAQDYLPKGGSSPEALFKSLRYAVERARRQKAEHELHAAQEEVRIAREIQQRLLPQHPPQLPGLDIAGATRFAGKLGGDMYDFVPMPEGRWGVAIADASGHDLRAALLIVQARAMIRAFLSLALDLGDVVTRTNRFLVADTEDSLFVTLFLLLLDPRSASFVSVSAGHNAYLFEPEKHVKVLRSTGLPLGIDDTATFLPTAPVTLEPGQILVLVTDGISEAATAENSLFGMKRLTEVVHGSRNRSAREIVEAVLEASHAFSATGSRHDDKTAIVVKRNPIS